MLLADVSIRRPVFAAMMIAALVVFGFISYPRLGVDLFPPVEFPVITVTVVYPGADPETMERDVADPIEESVQSLNGVDMLSSLNMEGVSQIVLQFELEVDVDQALQDVRDKVSVVEGQLPGGIEPPQVQKFDIGAAPVLSVGLSGDVSAKELSELADNRIKPALEQVNGVGGVDLIGAREREIQILVEPRKLVSYGLTVQDVASAVGAQSIDLPAGYSQQGARELTVKTRAEARSPAEIAALVIPGAPGTLIRIADVAEVVDGMEDQRSAASLDGVSAVALVVRKQSGANTVDVAAGVREAVAQLQQEYESRGITLSIPKDDSVFIEHSINDLQFDLLLGAGLTVLIIFVFLNDGRATFISALALPTSVVGTFLVMQIFGFTFNNMTMLALSLSIGILVDDAIVVIENIHRHLEMGKTKTQAAQEATSEIGLAVLATTMSIVAVFVPVAVMQGLIGRFFFQFGITVAAAVLLSMFVSFSLTPLLASRILKSQHGKKGRFARAVDWTMGRTSEGYGRILAGALRHPFLTLLAASATFGGALVLLTQVPVEFLPPEDRAQFAVHIDAPTGTALPATEGVVLAVAADIREHLPGVRTTFATVGNAQGSNVSEGSVDVMMVGSKARGFTQHEAMAWVRDRYRGIEQVEITVEEIEAVGGGGQSSAPVQFVIQGEDIDELNRIADGIEAQLREITGFVDVKTSDEGQKPEITMEIDRARAADLGVPVAAVAQALRALVAGDPVAELKQAGETSDIVVRLPEQLRSQIESLGNLEVRASSGQLIDLTNIVNVEESEAPNLISRLDRRRQVTVLANLDGLALGEAQEHVRTIAGDLVPGEMNTEFIGMVKIMEESFGYMLVALGLAVVIVYMILAAQFNSFWQPIAIMISLPLSFVGAFGGLFLAGMTLNIFSMIGLIMLMGLVTKNAILLVDFTNHARESGEAVFDALVSAGKIRLRPILMTTAAMIFGMLPVALAISEGGETRAPMAVAVIGGLITSTLLTLVVVPAVYLLFDKAVHSRAFRWLGGAGPDDEPPTPPADDGVHVVHPS